MGCVLRCSRLTFYFLGYMPLCLVCIGYCTGILFVSVLACHPAGCGGPATLSPLTAPTIAKETSSTSNGRSATSNSRTDGSRMTEAGQSLRDPSRLMRRRGTRHPTRFISQQIIHVDPAANKANPVNYCKQFLRFGTWNVLSLVSSSTQLYQLSQNLDQYRMDLLGITETHMPGSGTTLLDNGSHPLW